MDHDEDRSLSLGTEISVSVPPPSPLTGCYLLAVIGEPHTDEHKEIILQRLVKGLQSWDSNEHQVDLEKELMTLTAQAPEGEDARNGERLIQFASENLVTEILIHPQMNTLMQCMRNLLSSFTRHRHLIHAGYTFAGNGSWIVQDGTFSLADFTDAYQENEVQRVIRAYENSISIDIHCSTMGGGEWANLPQMPFVKYCKLRVNPTDILDSGSQAIKDFVGYLNPYIIPASLEQLLVSSDVVGNIRFSHPTLYVFPGGQGDAALFGINGFNMLVDGGFSRKACWWDFARHLDRLDAVMLTRVNNCSVAGMAAVLKRKAGANVYPHIGHFFCNLEERRVLSSPDGDKDSDPLLVSLLQEGSDMMADVRHINLKPQHCWRSPDPINLYHKVGHGTLDMYVLNPSKDSKHVRDFLKKWHGSEQNLFEGPSVSGPFNFPIPNIVSICALLVWRPANPDENVTRLMFPGSTPQHKIFEGLEKLKHLEFLQHPKCTGRQITTTPSPVPTAVHTTVKISTTKTTKDKLSTTEKKDEKTEKESVIKTGKDRITSEKKSEKNFDANQTEKFTDEDYIDNKLINELINGEDKKIESVLREAITSRVETKLDSTSIESITKKQEFKKKDKIMAEKKIKRIEKIEDNKEATLKSEAKKSENENKVKMDIRKKIDTKVSSTITRAKLTQKSSQKVSEKKIVTTTGDKKPIIDKSPPPTPKKTSETKATKEPTPPASARLKTKIRKQSPGSTPAKSTKEANNRRVVESKYKQASPKRELTAKPIDKKEIKAKREPISRRSRPLGSPVKAVKLMKSPTKALKSIKIDPKLKGLQRVNYEDILKDAKKSDEENSKSIDDFKQDIDDKEEQEIVREIEAVFNRDSEADEKIEYIGRSDIEKITCLIGDAKTEASADGEFEEEYLIIEKEEMDQYTEESALGNEPQEQEDELKKHDKDKKESEKKKDATEMVSQKIDVEEEITVDTKPTESKEHSLSVEEKQDLSSEKKTSDSKNGQARIKNLLPETQQDEKVSSQITVESGATTTAPTLPDDERITLDDIKEDNQVEEKYVNEDTKEILPPQTLADIPMERKVNSSQLRDIVKTPDEVADLPLHEEVDYQTYEEKKTPLDENKLLLEDSLEKPIQIKDDDVFKRLPDVGFVHEIKVPKNLPLPDPTESITALTDTEPIEDDVIVTTLQKPSHAEVVTVTPGSAPESPMYPENKDFKDVLVGKPLDTVKEHEGAEYCFGFTEKLRETHITTVESPLKETAKIIEEISCLPDKIPSIPEDVEKEIEEAKLLDGEKSPKSPKEVEQIVASVAEVLKSEKSLEELIAYKSTLVSHDGNLMSKSETKEDNEPEKMYVTGIQNVLSADLQRNLNVKDNSPARSTTPDEGSDGTEKTVLSEAKKLLEIKPENNINEISSTVLGNDDLELVKLGKVEDLRTIELTEDQIASVSISEADISIISERKLSNTLESAKTLEKLEEKISELRKKDEEKHDADDEKCESFVESYDKAKKLDLSSSEGSQILPYKVKKKDSSDLTTSITIKEVPALVVKADDKTDLVINKDTKPDLEKDSFVQDSDQVQFSEVKLKLDYKTQESIVDIHDAKKEKVKESPKAMEDTKFECENDDKDVVDHAVIKSKLDQITPEQASSEKMEVKLTHEKQITAHVSASGSVSPITEEGYQEKSLEDKLSITLNIARDEMKTTENLNVEFKEIAEILEESKESHDLTTPLKVSTSISPSIELSSIDAEKPTNLEKTSDKETKNLSQLVSPALNEGISKQSYEGQSAPESNKTSRPSSPENIIKEESEVAKDDLQVAQAILSDLTITEHSDDFSSSDVNPTVETTAMKQNFQDRTKVKITSGDVTKDLNRSVSPDKKEDIIEKSPREIPTNAELSRKSSRAGSIPTEETDVKVEKEMALQIESVSTKIEDVHGILANLTEITKSTSLSNDVLTIAHPEDTTYIKEKCEITSSCEVSPKIETSAKIDSLQVATEVAVIIDTGSKYSSHSVSPDISEEVVKKVIHGKPSSTDYSQDKIAKEEDDTAPIAKDFGIKHDVTEDAEESKISGSHSYIHQLIEPSDKTIHDDAVLPSEPDLAKFSLESINTENRDNSDNSLESIKSTSPTKVLLVQQKLEFETETDIVKSPSKEPNEIMEVTTDIKAPCDVESQNSSRPVSPRVKEEIIKENMGTNQYPISNRAVSPKTLDTTATEMREESLKVEDDAVSVDDGEVTSDELIISRASPQREQTSPKDSLLENNDINTTLVQELKDSSQIVNQIVKEYLVKPLNEKHSTPEQSPKSSKTGSPTSKIDVINEVDEISARKKHSNDDFSKDQINTASLTNEDRSTSYNAETTIVQKHSDEITNDVISLKTDTTSSRDSFEVGPKAEASNDDESKYSSRSVSPDINEQNIENIIIDKPISNKESQQSSNASSPIRKEFNGEDFNNIATETENKENEIQETLTIEGEPKQRSEFGSSMQESLLSVQVTESSIKSECQDEDSNADDANTLCKSNQTITMASKDIEKSIPQESEETSRSKSSLIQKNTNKESFQEKPETQEQSGRNESHDTKGSVEKEVIETTTKKESPTGDEHSTGDSEDKLNSQLAKSVKTEEFDNNLSLEIELTARKNILQNATKVEAAHDDVSKDSSQSLSSAISGESDQKSLQTKTLAGSSTTEEFITDEISVTSVTKEVLQDDIQKTLTIETNLEELCKKAALVETKTKLYDEVSITELTTSKTSSEIAMTTDFETNNKSEDSSRSISPVIQKDLINESFHDEPVASVQSHKSMFVERPVIKEVTRKDSLKLDTEDVSVSHILQKSEFTTAQEQNYEVISTTSRIESPITQAGDDSNLLTNTKESNQSTIPTKRSSLVEESLAIKEPHIEATSSKDSSEIKDILQSCSELEFEIPSKDSSQTVSAALKEDDKPVGMEQSSKYTKTGSLVTEEAIANETIASKQSLKVDVEACPADHVELKTDRSTMGMEKPNEKSTSRKNSIDVVNDINQTFNQEYKDKTASPTIIKDILDKPDDKNESLEYSQKLSETESPHEETELSSKDSSSKVSLDAKDIESSSLNKPVSKESPQSSRTSSPIAKDLICEVFNDTKTSKEKDQETPTTETEPRDYETESPHEETELSSKDSSSKISPDAKDIESSSLNKPVSKESPQSSRTSSPIAKDLICEVFNDTKTSKEKPETEPRDYSKPDSPIKESFLSVELTESSIKTESHDEALKTNHKITRKNSYQLSTDIDISQAQVSKDSIQSVSPTIQKEIDEQSLKNQPANQKRSQESSRGESPTIKETDIQEISEITTRKESIKHESEDIYSQQVKLITELSARKDSLQFDTYANEGSKESSRSLSPAIVKESKEILLQEASAEKEKSLNASQAVSPAIKGLITDGISHHPITKEILQDEIQETLTKKIDPKKTSEPASPVMDVSTDGKHFDSSLKAELYEEVSITELPAMKNIAQVSNDFETTNTQELQDSNRSGSPAIRKDTIEDSSHDKPKNIDQSYKSITAESLVTKGTAVQEESNLFPGKENSKPDTGDVSNALYLQKAVSIIMEEHGIDNANSKDESPITHSEDASDLLTDSKESNVSVSQIVSLKSQISASVEMTEPHVETKSTTITEQPAETVCTSKWESISEKDVENTHDGKSEDFTQLVRPQIIEESKELCLQEKPKSTEQSPKKSSISSPSLEESIANNDTDSIVANEMLRDDIQDSSIIETCPKEIKSVSPVKGTSSVCEDSSQESADSTRAQDCQDSIRSLSTAVHKKVEEEILHDKSSTPDQSLKSSRYTSRASIETDDAEVTVDTDQKESLTCDRKDKTAIVTGAKESGKFASMTKVDPIIPQISHHDDETVSNEVSSIIELTTRKDIINYPKDATCEISLKDSNLSDDTEIIKESREISLQDKPTSKDQSPKEGTSSSTTKELIANEDTYSTIKKDILHDTQESFIVETYLEESIKSGSPEFSTKLSTSFLSLDKEVLVPGASTEVLIDTETICAQESKDSDQPISQNIPKEIIEEYLHDKCVPLEQSLIPSEADSPSSNKAVIAEVIDVINHKESLICDQKDEITTVTESNESGKFSSPTKKESAIPPITHHDGTANIDMSSKIELLTRKDSIDNSYDIVAINESILKESSLSVSPAIIDESKEKSFQGKLASKEQSPNASRTSSPLTTDFMADEESNSAVVKENLDHDTLDSSTNEICSKNYITSGSPFKETSFPTELSTDYLSLDKDSSVPKASSQVSIDTDTICAQGSKDSDRPIDQNIQIETIEEYLHNTCVPSERSLKPSEAGCPSSNETVIAEVIQVTEHKESLRCDQKDETTIVSESNGSGKFANPIKTDSEIAPITHHDDETASIIVSSKIELITTKENIHDPTDIKATHEISLKKSSLSDSPAITDIGKGISLKDKPPSKEQSPKESRISSPTTTELMADEDRNNTIVKEILRDDNGSLPITGTCPEESLKLGSPDKEIPEVTLQVSTDTDITYAEPISQNIQKERIEESLSDRCITPEEPLKSSKTTSPSSKETDIAEVIEGSDQKEHTSKEKSANESRTGSPSITDFIADEERNSTVVEETLHDETQESSTIEICPKETIKSGSPVKEIFFSTELPASYISLDKEANASLKLLTDTDTTFAQVSEDSIRPISQSIQEEILEETVHDKYETQEPFQKSSGAGSPTSKETLIQEAYEKTAKKIHLNAGINDDLSIVSEIKEADKLASPVKEGSPILQKAQSVTKTSHLDNYASSEVIPKLESTTIKPSINDHTNIEATCDRGSKNSSRSVSPAIAEIDKEKPAQTVETSLINLENHEPNVSTDLTNSQAGPEITITRKDSLQTMTGYTAHEQESKYSSSSVSSTSERAIIEESRHTQIKTSEQSSDADSTATIKNIGFAESSKKAARKESLKPDLSDDTDIEKVLKIPSKPDFPTKVDSSIAKSTTINQHHDIPASSEISLDMEVSQKKDGLPVDSEVVITRESKDSSWSVSPVVLEEIKEKPLQDNSISMEESPKTSRIGSPTVTEFNIKEVTDTSPSKKTLQVDIQDASIGKTCSEESVETASREQESLLAESSIKLELNDKDLMSELSTNKLFPNEVIPMCIETTGTHDSGQSLSPALQNTSIEETIEPKLGRSGSPVDKESVTKDDTSLISEVLNQYSSQSGKSSPILDIEKSTTEYHHDSTNSEVTINMDITAHKNSLEFLTDVQGTLDGGLKDSNQSVSPDIRDENFYKSGFPEPTEPEQSQKSSRANSLTTSECIAKDQDKLQVGVQDSSAIPDIPVEKVNLQITDSSIILKHDEVPTNESVTIIETVAEFSEIVKSPSTELEGIIVAQLPLSAIENENISEIITSLPSTVSIDNMSISFDQGLASPPLADDNDVITYNIDISSRSAITPALADDRQKSATTDNSKIQSYNIESSLTSQNVENYGEGDSNYNTESSTKDLKDTKVSVDRDSNMIENDSEIQETIKIPLEPVFETKDIATSVEETTSDLIAESSREYSEKTEMTSSVSIISSQTNITSTDKQEDSIVKNTSIKSQFESETKNSLKSTDEQIVKEVIDDEIYDIEEQVDIGKPIHIEESVQRQEIDNPSKLIQSKDFVKPVDTIINTEVKASNGHVPVELDTTHICKEDKKGEFFPEKEKQTASGDASVENSTHSVEIPKPLNVSCAQISVSLNDADTESDYAQEDLSTMLGQRDIQSLNESIDIHVKLSETKPANGHIKQQENEPQESISYISMETGLDSYDSMTLQDQDLAKALKDEQLDTLALTSELSHQTYTEETDMQKSFVSIFESTLKEDPESIHTLASSSEDISKEISCEEKHSFECLEKESKKYGQIHNVITSSAIKTEIDSSHRESISTKTAHTESGSPKDISLSLTTDSGIMSLQADNKLGPFEGADYTQTLKDNAVNLMESVSKAFSEDSVQQGIKTESVDSFVVRSEFERVSTPPTVPVSPLPKTPSSVHDLKVTDGLQSELTYDKSEGAEETITKVIHVGDDILTQKISTCTEKAAKPEKVTAETDESNLSSLMQSMGKIRTETDTVTKVIKEGVNVVTQTITTVTTKEIISRDDGTPQNVKTTIETTTLSKGSDGSTTTTKDTQTLLSECSSSLKSTSQMDLYAKDIKLEKEYLDTNEEKSESLNSQISEKESSLRSDSSSTRMNSEQALPLRSEFITTVDDDSDDNIEDTVIDTDVSKQIIKEEGLDIVQTVITTTKKEVLKLDDTTKILRITTETNITKERPDGSKDIQKNVDVRTEKIHCETKSPEREAAQGITLDGKIEQSKSSTHQDDYVVDKNQKIEESQRSENKFNTEISSSLVKDTIYKDEDKSVTSDIPIEQVLEEFIKLEDKTINVETQEKTISREGVLIKQKITITTIKEILTSEDGSKKKLKTTIETVTESKLPNGATEVVKDIKIAIADYGPDIAGEELEGCDFVGEPEEQTSSHTEEIFENNVKVTRKTTVTTIRQEFENTNRVRKVKTIVRTVIEDEHPNGTIFTKKSEKTSIADVFLNTPRSENEELQICDAYTDNSELVEDVSEDTDVKNETIQKENQTIIRTVTTKTKRETLNSSNATVKRVRTTVETITVDEYPNGVTETTKDVKITVSEIQTTSDSELQSALAGLQSTGKIKTSEDKKHNVLILDGEEVKQTITTNVTKEEFKCTDTEEVAIKTVTETITETTKKDGSIEISTDLKTQITYLPHGATFEDLTEEHLDVIEKQPVLDQTPPELFLQQKVVLPTSKQKSPMREALSDTEVFTKHINENGVDVEQTITVVTTKELVSPDKVKTTIETTTVNKGSDGVTKTLKATKTSFSDLEEKYATGESEKSFSKTDDLRSSSAASDDLAHGFGSPPSDLSSRESKATHAWGTESSGLYYSDEDGPGSPSSTKSQIAHSPRSNLSFELEPSKTYGMEVSFNKDPMSSSIYAQLPEELHHEIKTEKTITKLTHEFLTNEKLRAEENIQDMKVSDASFLTEADEHFDKAIEEHKKVSGSKVISNITAKYDLDLVQSTSHQETTSKESQIILQDIISDAKKVTEIATSSTSKEETKAVQSESSESTTITTTKDPIESWGKPLGLPSPIMPPTHADGKSTPKKQNPMLNKNKINQEKNKEARKSSESPSKRKPAVPVYLDLTYVPHHGNSYYSAVEFFKRVRARYYVFSGTEPSKEIYNALLDAKKTWEDKELEVTIIPTYDTDVLGYWVTENEDALEKYKIDLSPSASRCTINLQDHETSCAAYRLEF